MTERGSGVWFPGNTATVPRYSHCCQQDKSFGSESEQINNKLRRFPQQLNPKLLQGIICIGILGSLFSLTQLPQGLG